MDGAGSRAADFVVEALEVCFNMILYQRNVYPVSAFHRRHRFEVPVRMAKHKELAAYIGKVLRSVRAWFRPDTLHRVVLVIFAPSETPTESPTALERFVFDVAFFADPPADDDAAQREKHEDYVRSLFLKINTLETHLEPNPKGGTFTWTVLLYTNEYRPKVVSAGHPEHIDAWRDWVAETSPAACLELDTPSIHPVMDIETSSFALSLKVEEGREAKGALGPTQPSQPIQ